MRRVLFLTLVVVMLLSISTSVFADQPQQVDQNYVGQLGEVWFHNYGGFWPYEQVDAQLHRPSTLVSWPFPDPPAVGSAWAVVGESAYRRQTFAYADGDGYVFTGFKLPKEETWYPCSFPLKWKCGLHSPATQPFQPPLVWPYASNPMDIVAPLEVVLEGTVSGNTWVIPFEITGYFWRVAEVGP